MGVFFQGGSGRRCGWLSAVAVVGLWCAGAAAGSASLMTRVRVEGARRSPWDAAVGVRQRFEAEPAGTHTRKEYAAVMEEFRAIYHGDPGDAHAARAVAQVAELLDEQGRELGDAKSLHDAAGQYEFLAKAYPGGTMAPRALEQALDLLGPRDAAEARRVKAELAEDYPRFAREFAAVHTSDDRTVAKLGRPTEGATVVHDAGLSTALRSGRNDSVRVMRSGRDDRSVGTENMDSVRDDNAGSMRTAKQAERDALPAEPVVSEGGRVIPEVPERKQAGPLSIVTGIRHWSTASYTRVAIDLTVDPGEDVRYEAARVEHPDRIFFDLHHARLAPQLAGRIFTVTDDGFLTRIRAAQFSDDVTRVVLDVHEVADYSAFLLPNPYRLIIDIHGKAAGSANREDAAADRMGAPANAAGANPDATPAETNSQSAASEAVGTAEVSSLPPMPVTDGSARFGLPVRNAEAARTERIVARPRVVIPSRATVAKPVPNTVTHSSSDTGVEVAEVSDQPGKVEATRRPTSKPISSGIREERTGIRDRGAVAAEPAYAAPPTADGERSLTRALGLKIGRIVIDAGHGGHDSGTLGVGGIEEKNVVLDVALRLGKLLHDRLGADVVYTRADDTFIPLETRTAIANKAQADLFISVHANSSQDPDARGVEVYYLNFTSDPEAMTVASRENAVSTESVHELSDLVKKIALRDKIDESKELASDVDASLYAGLRRGNPGLKDRGVKKAPFVVLIGANMPSILAEISFVTNPTDAAKLETPEYRERVAESLYKGIARYAEGINGVRPRTPAVEQAQSYANDGR